MQVLKTYNLKYNLFKFKEISQIPTSKLLSLNIVDEHGSNLDLNKISG
jgi:hypothetical protein